MNRESCAIAIYGLFTQSVKVRIKTHRFDEQGGGFFFLMPRPNRLRASRRCFLWRGFRRIFGVQKNKHRPGAQIFQRLIRWVQFEVFEQYTSTLGTRGLLLLAGNQARKGWKGPWPLWLVLKVICECFIFPAKLYSKSCDNTGTNLAMKTES